MQVERKPKSARKREDKHHSVKRLSQDRWASLASAVARQHLALPPNDPRVRPTLPHLNFMRADARDNGSGPLAVALDKIEAA
jgi:hypothetical protein